MKIYYLLYDIIDLVERNGFWYCFCNETSGCERKLSKKKWCLLCIVQLDEKIDVDEVKKIKSMP